jgi:hypothetical protein
MNTAILNCSLIFCNFDKNLPRTYCLSESSPLPEKSTLKGAIIESIISNENESSTIAPAAYISKVLRLSTVKALPTIILLRTSSASRSYLFEMSLILSGLNVFSVSIYKTLP